MFKCQMVGCSTLVDQQQRTHGHRYRSQYVFIETRPFTGYEAMIRSNQHQFILYKLSVATSHHIALTAISNSYLQFMLLTYLQVTNFDRNFCCRNRRMANIQISSYAILYTVVKQKLCNCCINNTCSNRYCYCSKAVKT